METKSTTIPFEYGISEEMPPEQMLTTQDQQCFEEINQILEKYKAKRRFGLTLLDPEKLTENKIRLETNSYSERTLLTRIFEKDTLTGKNVQTNWRLNTMKAVAACENACRTNYKGGKHSRNHEGGNQGIGG